MNHVLVIDDDAALRRLSSSALRSAGFTVQTAADGIEALESLREDMAVVLVLDLAMPGMDGRELFRRLAQLGSRPPTIVVSAFGARAAQRELGAESSLAKPFEPEKLIQEVQRLYER